MPKGTPPHTHTENGTVWLLGLSPCLLGTLGNPPYGMWTSQKPSGQGQWASPHPLVYHNPRESDIPELSPLLVGEGGGHNWENYFICLFYVSEHLNHLFNFFIHFYFFPEN